MASNRPGSARISSNSNLNEPSSKTTVKNTRTSSANLIKYESTTKPIRNLHNIESFSCFWLDENISTMNKNQQMENELKKVINHIEIFENLEQCERNIKANINDKIVLIISSLFAQQIVPRIHDLLQVNSCYIFCDNSIADANWVTGYHKVKGIFTQQSDLLKQIIQDQKVRIKMEDAAGISVVSDNIQSLESRNAMFMWFQLFIEVLLRMHHKSNTKQELIDICKQYYHDNTDELKLIDEFARTYKSENAIWWYTRECCLYKILNRALRTQDFDILFALRFLITDLSKQLTDEYESYLRSMTKRDKIRVYRGQAIGLNELKLIQTSLGQFISMNSFLSTSIQRQTAISFLDTIEITCQTERILFEIDIDPCQKTKPFSDIDRLSYFKNEGEVLIMLGALFSIQSINRNEEKRFWIANLNLVSEDHFHLKETFTHMKAKIGDETNMHSLGKILTEMGEYKQAQKCYKRMIFESQLDASVGYSGLGWADHWINEYDQSLSNLQKGLSLIEDILPSICEEKGRLNSFIGLVYWRKKQYDLALKHLKAAFDIQQKILPPEHPDLLATYNRFAITYSAMNDVNKALEYYEKCLEIRLATLPHDHPDIATSYNNIGWLYNERIGEHSKALDLFEKALIICRKTLPPTHRDIVRTEQNVQKAIEKMKKRSDDIIQEDKINS